MNSIWRTAGKIIGGGVLLAVFSNVSAILLAREDGRSLDAYRNIALRMTRQEVDSILKQQKVGCIGVGPTTQQCEFSDYWRTYSIHFDPADRVDGKGFQFKE